MAKIFQINTADNVVVAVEPLTKGEKLEFNGNTYIAQSDIPAGHKMAIKAIAQGENVIKYGFPEAFSSSVRRPHKSTALS